MCGNVKPVFKLSVEPCIEFQHHFIPLQEDCHESTLVEELESLYGNVREAEVRRFA